MEQEKKTVTRAVYNCDSCPFFDMEAAAIDNNYCAVFHGPHDAIDRREMDGDPPPKQCPLRESNILVRLGR